MPLKDKPEVRYALWQSYQRRCSICLEDLFNYSDLEIDHIIPEATFKDEQKVIEAVTNYNLPIDFNFNGLENLRPAHKKCNNAKRNNELTEEIIARLLLKAKKKIEDVNKNIKKFENEARHALNIEVIRKQLHERQITLEEYMDRINNYIADFGVDEYKSFSKDEKFLRYTNKTVTLEGYLPVIGENTGSCLFTFNSFYIRGTTISLSHKEILSGLYYGIKTPMNYEMRRYIVAKYDGNNYIIQLGNSRFNLNYEEVVNLCVVIDKFVLEYIDAIKELEEIIDCKEFIPNFYDSWKYHLIKVDIGLWNRILEFARKYDYEKGRSQWHIFDASASNMLKIYIKENNDKYNEGYKCIIHSFIEDHYSWTPSDYVWLLWNDMSISKEYGVKDYWTVKYTFEWLIRELIPKVNQKDSFIKPKGFIKIKEYTNMKRNNYFIEGEIRYFSSSNIENITQLLNLVVNIQLFYSRNGYVCINKNNLVNLYRAVLNSINACKKLNYHYICSKIGMDSAAYNKADIQKFIKSKIDYYNDLIDTDLELIKISSNKLDHIFRVFYCALEELKNELNREQIQDYLLLIEWFINDFNTAKLVEYYQ